MKKDIGNKKSITTIWGTVILVIEVAIFALIIYYVSQQVENDLSFPVEPAGSFKTQNININAD